MTGPGLHLAMLAGAAGGFLSLALASDKPGAALLGQRPGARARAGLRLAGGILLGLALACGIGGWGAGIGWATWFGWLMMAGAGLAFACPYWDRARNPPPPDARPRRPQAPQPLAPPLSSRAGRGIVLALLVLAPPAFLAAVALWPQAPG